MSCLWPRSASQTLTRGSVRLLPKTSAIEFRANANTAGTVRRRLSGLGWVYVASHAQLNIFGLSQGSSVVSAADVTPPSPRLATDALYVTITQIMDSEFSVKSEPGVRSVSMAPLPGHKT